MSDFTGLTTSAPAGFYPVSSVGDVPPGWVLRVSAGGRDIALSNVAGQFHALDNSCSHAGGPLAPNHLSPACTLECPWHNSIFDAATGEVVAGPARKPVRAYRVRVLDGVVYVSVDPARPGPVPTGPAAGTSTDG